MKKTDWFPFQVQGIAGNYSLARNVQNDKP